MPRRNPPAAIPRRRQSVAVAGVLVLWALAMAPLLEWGLPTSRSDELLFGGQRPWTADQFRAAADFQQLSTRDAGADTDLNPLAECDGPVCLTSDETARAEILRRYRLYSCQPDEMIVWRALQRMDPRRLDFDPRLYQYGGGYIYLVGGTLASSAALGLVRLTSDVGVYLERPELFARFYVVARAVSLVFGALTLLAVYKLARRAGGPLAGRIALVSAASSPVFFTAVLEAKPHLPSACLLLWATLSALDFQRGATWRSALHLGWQAGYAASLVLTGVVAALLWPVLLCGALARAPGGRRTLRRLLAAGGLALAVWIVCNPYVPYNWFMGRAALDSNITNSTAMYRDQVRRAPQGAANVARLLVESAGLGVAVLGLVGLLGLARRLRGRVAAGSAVGLGMLLLCILLGAGKPAEFARFLILPVLLLNVAAAWFLASVARRRPVGGFVSTVLVLALARTPAYLQSFISDVRGDREPRALAALFLQANMDPTDAVGLVQEPAPYSVPPLDFTRRAVWLLPATRPADLDAALLPKWLVFTADEDTTHGGAWWHGQYGLVQRFPPASVPLSPITWASKPTFVYRKVP